jgi:transcriptional regulator with XRE-family HTH domain
MATRTCRVCSARLSRYNDDPLCASCTASARGAGPGVPTWLWDSPLLRQALADADLGRWLAVLRAAAGLSQLELGTMLGWSQSTIGRIESGERETLYDVREFLRVADALDVPRTALGPLLAGTAVAIPPSNGEEAETDLDRRTFGIGMLGLVGSAAIGLDKVQVPARVDSAHIRYLRATVDRLYVRDQVAGGGALVRGALRQMHRIDRMLEEADYGEATGRELMAAAGQLAVATGWIAYDGGQQKLARQLYSQALLLADQADDELLSVMAMEKMALQQVFLSRVEQRPGLAREAVRLAVRAADLARRSPWPRLHALLASREAIAHAALGDDRGYKTAITRSWRELDRGTSDDDPVWLRFVKPAEVSVAEAKGQMILGRPARAADLYRAGLEEPKLSPRNSVNYRAQLAAALAAEGDTTAAVGEGLAVLPALESRVTSPRTLRELREVRVIAGGDGAAEEFRTRFDAVERTVQT